MKEWLVPFLLGLTVLVGYTFAGNMGLFTSNHFEVDGKTVLVTGGSQGMGKSVARILAGRGANVIIVARTESKLKDACEYISRIEYISADLSSSSECARVVAEATKMNGGAPPDVVWCCAGTSVPTLLIDTPPEILSQQMSGNYLSSAWIAQAAIRSWVRPSASTTPPPMKVPTFHLIFTSSLVAFYPVAGYSPYTPTKSALRGLTDTLSQEVELYRPTADVRVHTVFPATILTEGYEHENTLKSDVTKMLEEDDDGQTPDACAAAAISGLEAGRELIHTAFLTRLLMCAGLGGSRRAPGFAGFLDSLLALVMLVVMPVVRWFYDGKVRSWAKKHGPSGMKSQ